MKILGVMLSLISLMGCGSAVNINLGGDQKSEMNTFSRNSARDPYFESRIDVEDTAKIQ